MTLQEQVRVLAVVGAIAATGIALWLMMTVIAGRDRKGRLAFLAYLDWLVFVAAVVVAAVAWLMR